jgi:hypothetical protein
VVKHRPRARREEDCGGQRVLEAAKLEERARALATLITDLIASKVPQEKTLALSEIERATTAKIEELSSAVEKRLRLERRPRFQHFFRRHSGR